MEIKSSIIFVRSVNPEYDSRLNKFADVFQENGINFKILWWNRLDEKTTGDRVKNMVEFRRRGMLGGRWKNLMGLFLWNLYVFYWLMKNAKKINVVQAVDLDCIIPSFFFSKIFRKKIIFDVYDKYSDAKSFSGYIGNFLDIIENFFIKKSDLSILVDECRYRQHNIERANNILVIENVPDKLNFHEEREVNREKHIILGYFGSLEPKHRGLEDLVNVVIKSDNLKLVIAGYGELASFIKKMSDLYPLKIDFKGMLGSQQGLSIMRDVDIYIGMYYRTNKNHFWAAPNKYFEHLMLGIPLLTTIGTPPGNKVSYYKTGWAVEEGENSLEVFLSKINKKEIEEKSINSFSLWKNNYSSYYDDFYRGIYFSRVNALI